MDLISIVVILVGLAFLALLGLAANKLRKKRIESKDELARLLEEPTAEESVEEDVSEARAEEDLERAGDLLAEQEDRDRLAQGLGKTRSGLIGRLGKLFGSKAAIDPALLDELEETLFTADIGTKTSQALIDDVKTAFKRNQISKPDEIWELLETRASTLLDEVDPSPLTFESEANPFVLLIVGVNGVGKTTTIGKLAARLQQRGLNVLLAAGDTFRAAAVEQLRQWGDRAQVPVVSGKEGADPSSVMVEALRRAKQENIDIVIADTAGRLHTKTSLMDELKKVYRTIGKEVPGAPHETFLVLDATTGQNAIAQANTFKEVANITGIVLTKLDGTAKGGVILGIAHELKVPVRFVGVGEKVDDLRVFDAKNFAKALFDRSSLS